MNTTTLETKSVHQLILEFESLFYGVWTLTDFETKELPYISVHSKQYLTLNQLFDFIITPINKTTLISICVWYISNMEFPNQRLNLTKERIFADIHKLLVMNKRSLIRKLYLHQNG